eukprot:TRINITY_DN767_c2_g1_i1.p2 TRINITY_DN767_c2_g1~~TRINITY_DN767_c2_g1_i1.p2  ORF type:complete len:299 (+),score=127.95 TRINITY_DN767_c2_g1_i1:60-956(+)
MAVRRLTTLLATVPDAPASQMRLCTAKASSHAKDRFHGKGVIITGGAGDFGMNCGLRMAAEGASVALFDLAGAKLDEATAKVRAAAKAGKVVSYAADVTNPAQVEKAVAAAFKELGGVQYLFNNAGYQGAFKNVKDYDAEDFKRVLDVNVLGAFNVMKATANEMIRRNIHGSIVNTASKAATNCPPNMPAYAASKGAVWSMSQQAAKDLAPFHIRVNSVSPAFIGPGFMWTRQTELQAGAGSMYYDADPKVVEQQMIDSTPMRRVGSVQEVMGVVTYLFSDDSSYVTGMDHTVTGGLI